MFFIEAIFRYLKKDKFNEIIEEKEKNESQNPLETIAFEDTSMIEPLTDCKHLFMPVDSSGEILACSKCGEIRNKSTLKDINFFHKNLS